MLHPAVRWRVPSVLLLFLIIQCPETIAAEPRTFVWFSDIHLDPFYGTDQAAAHSLFHPECGPSQAATHRYGNFGCDSPPLLIESLLQQASSLSQTITADDDINNSSSSSNSNKVSEEEADFMVITGDFVRHDNDLLRPNPMNATQQILYTISQQIRQYFPTLPVALAVGNNDVTPDYYLDIEQPREMLDMVYGGLKPLLTNSMGDSGTTMTGEEDTNTFAAANSFHKGGYYAIDVTDRITILSLNTVVYSTNHQPEHHNNNNNNNNEDDPLGQFAWLDDQLIQAAQNQRVVYIMGHIPPTIGSYRHTQLWQDRYLQRYYDMMKHHHRLAGIVKAQLFGHIHTDEFRIHKRIFPIYLTSSFTPIYGSNPSFRVMTYDSETGDLLDYHVRYLDFAMTVTNTLSEENTLENDNTTKGNNTTVASPLWKKGPSFTEAYQVPDMSLKSLELIVKDLQNSTDHSVYWEALLNRLHVYTHGSEVCDAKCRIEWSCTLTSMFLREYRVCLYESHVENDPLLVVVVFLLLALVFVLGVFVLCRYIQRCGQRRHYEVPKTDLELEVSGAEQQLPELS